MVQSHEAHDKMWSVRAVGDTLRYRLKEGAARRHLSMAHYLDYMVTRDEQEQAKEDEEN